MTQKTKISDAEKALDAQTAKKQGPAKGSMADVEKAHGAPPADPAAAKRKAAKARIDCAAHGVPDSTPKAK